MKIKTEKSLSLLLMLVLITLTACAPTTPTFPAQGDQESPPEETSGTSPSLPPTQPGKSPAEDTPDRTNRVPVSTPPEGLERVETPPAEPVTGEVPAEILNEIFLDLIDRTDALREDIQVLRAEAIVWNDGSLGCAKPGEVYIQILVNGYWVVLEVEGKSYDYRVSDTGYFTLCEGRGFIPVSTPPGSGTGPSPDQ